jgi:hypothetical protein
MIPVYLEQNPNKSLISRNYLAEKFYEDHPDYPIKERRIRQVITSLMNRKYPGWSHSINPTWVVASV